MNTGIRRALIRAAIFSTPVISLLLITPLFIATDVPPVYLSFVFPVGMLAITICWMMHYQLMRIPRFRNIWRFVLISSFMISIMLITVSMVKPQLVVGTRIIDLSARRFDVLRMLLILVVNLSVYIISNLVITSENNKKLGIENAQLKIANLEAQYKLLKDQINPHFIFNALNTAKSLTRQDPKLAEEYIVLLSELLRASISSKENLVLLRDELELSGKYISLQKKRFGEALQFTGEPDPLLLRRKVPHFAIVTLLENAVKHNSMTIENPLFIRLSADEDSITVSNNINLKPRLSDSTQTGLQNLNERYVLLSGAPIGIRQNAHEFSVTIQLLPE